MARFVTSPREGMRPVTAQTGHPSGVVHDGFRVRDYLDGIFGDVGGDRRILRRVTEAEQSFARHQRHARIRIEFRFLRLGANS